MFSLLTGEMNRSKFVKAKTKKITDNSPSIAIDVCEDKRELPARVRDIKWCIV